MVVLSCSGMGATNSNSKGPKISDHRLGNSQKNLPCHVIIFIMVLDNGKYQVASFNFSNTHTFVHWLSTG